MAKDFSVPKEICIAPLIIHFLVTTKPTAEQNYSYVTGIGLFVDGGLAQI
jgi:hypothetical protein